MIRQSMLTKKKGVFDVLYEYGLSTSPSLDRQVFCTPEFIGLKVTLRAHRSSVASWAQRLYLAGNDSFANDIVDWSYPIRIILDFVVLDNPFIGSIRRSVVQDSVRRVRLGSGEKG